RFLIGPCFLGLVINLALHYPALAESNPDKDPHFRELVAESEQLAKAKKPSAAIALCDTVIAAFKAYYGKEQRKIYCGNSSTEVLGNLLQAAVKKGKRHRAFADVGQRLLHQRVRAAGSASFSRSEGGDSTRLRSFADQFA